LYPGGVAVTLSDGRIVFVNESGKQTAVAQMDQAPMGPALAKDGFVYGADAWGSVYKFRLSGERVWKHQRETRAGSGYNTPVLASWSGRTHVIVTDTRGHLYAVDTDGKLQLEITATTYRLSTPAVGDVDGDAIPDIVFGADDGTVYCVSADGRLIWERKLAGGRFGRSVPLIADADGDGASEVYMTTPFVGTQTGLHALDGKTGTPRWHFKSEMQTYASLVAMDLDGDGKKEILLGDKNTRLYALNVRGEKVWDTQMGGRGIFYAAAAAGDWIYQIVRDTGLDGKSLYVLDKQGKVRLPVAMDGGGSYGPVLSGSADGLRLLAVTTKGTLHCYRVPSGAVHWSSWRNSTSSDGYLAIAKAPRSGGTRPPMAAKEQRRAHSGTNVIPGAKAHSLLVERPDGSRVFTIGSAAFTAVQKGQYRVTADGGAPVVYTLENDTFALQAPPTEFGDAVSARLQAEFEFAAKHPTAERFDRLHRQAEEARELFAAMAGKPAADLLIRQLDNPWEANPKFRADPSLTLLGNEYESAAFIVTNLRPETAQIRVTADVRFVDIREMPLVRPESTGRLTEDVLPRLNESNTFRLQPGESKKLWAIVNSRDLKPGTHTAMIRAGDMLSLAKPMELKFPVEVSRARLPEKRVYKQCHWLYLASIADERLRDATMRDALEHGMNVFPIPSLTYPVMANGELGKPESAVHDSLVTKLRGKATFLVSGSVGLSWPENVRPSEALANKTYAAAIRKYSEHMIGLGLAFDDWAYYYMDEPGLMGKDASFDKYVRDIARVKEADPRVRIYANPAGGARPPMLAPLTKLVDVWQPDLHLVREHPEEYRRIFQTGTYWHYEAGADQRNLDSLGYYRMKPWVAFQMGMTGGGYWVYSFSPFWFFDQAMGVEYGTVYPSPDGPVTTKRWEASRDGAEDFDLLWQVRELARKANNRAALSLVDEAVAFVTKGQENVSDISRQVEPFAPDYSQWMQYRRQLIAAWEQML